MSLHYRQGIFVTDNKNRLSSEQVKSSHTARYLFGLGKAEGRANEHNGIRRLSRPFMGNEQTVHSWGWDPVGQGAGNLQILPKHTLPRLLPLSLRKPIDMSTKPVCHLQPTLYFLFHADSSFDKTTEVHLYFQS